MTNVTQILDQIQQGDSLAADELLPLVYDELRELAAARLAHEEPGQTLQATALVHEAYLRLLGPGGCRQSWDNRGHFFAAAAEAMRRILVERARRRSSQKGGAGRRGLELRDSMPERAFDRAEALRVLAVHEALTVLEAEFPRRAQLVKLRFFGGLTFEESAQALGVAVPTAKRDWVAARVWIYRYLAASSENSAGQ